MPVTREILSFAQHNIKDTQGRPYAFRESEQEFVKNNIPGREGHPTDLKSLAEFNQNRSKVLALIRYLRKGFPPQPLNPADLFDLSAAISALPIYLVLRPFRPVDLHSMSPSLIDASRATRGVNIAIVVGGQSTIGINEQSDSKGIYDFVNGGNPERRNYFTQTEEANSPSCPVSERLVLEVINTMIHYPRPEEDIFTFPDWDGLVTEVDFPRIFVFGPAFVTYMNYANFIRENSGKDVGQFLMQQVGLLHDMNQALANG